MKGLELSRKYYEEFGKPMLEDKFADLFKYIAVGICGQGSECYGYDDEISRDHDFEPGFIIFLPDESIINRRQAFLLERAYYALPKEFCGIRRLSVAPVGGSRHGVIRTSDFFKKTIGSADGVLSLFDWLYIPGFLLSEATNGEIFLDNYGELTKIRKRLSGMPEDARRKRLAGKLLSMAQSGQYNYLRCLAHGESAAAQVSLFKFTQCVTEAIFLLNNTPMPYYKWAFRALRDLPLLGEETNNLEYLITSENTLSNADRKVDIIESICDKIAKSIEKQGIAKYDNEIERLSYAVNDTIKDSGIRDLNIFTSA